MESLLRGGGRERRAQKPRELGEMFARLGRDGQKGAVGGLVRGGEGTAAPPALGGLHGVPLRGSHDRRDAGVLEKKHHREVARLRLACATAREKGSPHGGDR